MCEIISLEKYQNRKHMKESPNTISDKELAALEENVWQICQALGLDQFFINLFTADIPEGKDTERG